MLLNCSSIGHGSPLDPQQKGSLFSSVPSNYSCRKGVVAAAGNSEKGCIGKVKGTKMGRACIYSLLSLVSWGDKGLIRAMQNGNITEVTAIDVSDTNVLRPTNLFPFWFYIINFSLYSQECIIVWGN